MRCGFTGMIHEHPELGLNNGPGRTVVLRRRINSARGIFARDGTATAVHAQLSAIAEGH